MGSAILLAALIALYLVISLCRSAAHGGRASGAKGAPPARQGYPYRPDVEFRLPDGRLTTRGYAAVHPGEFAHWQFGPDNVLGERIDRDDWENWRINYYGM